MTLCGRAKYYRYYCTYLFHVHIQNTPLRGMGFFWPQSIRGITESKNGHGDTSIGHRAFTVSMGRHWFVCRRKETAALKIKAAASNGRVDRLLYDGFFSFAVVRQLVPFALILTSNPHRNVTDTRCFDRIMGWNLTNLWDLKNRENNLPVFIANI